MAQQFLHLFRLTVEGLPETVEFRMFHELDDVTEVTDAFSKYVARQEDDFLPARPRGGRPREPDSPHRPCPRGAGADDVRRWWARGDSNSRHTV